MTTPAPTCADLEPAEVDRLFFSTVARHVERARKLCQQCPVAEACLRLALEAEELEPAGYRFGVYGATTGLERAEAVGASTYTLHASPTRERRRQEARA